MNRSDSGSNQCLHGLNPSLARRGMLSGIAAGAAGWLAASSAAATDAATPPLGVNVRALGAKGDGVTDDTEAFQEALRQAEAGGGPVLAPPGIYRINATLSLTDTAVVGLPHAAFPADTAALPSIVPDHRDGPAFELRAGGALLGVDITYQWADEPEAGPPAVRISGIGAYVANCRIRYAWDGIVSDGVSNVGRTNIENVFMAAVRNCGVRLTGTWDVPRLANVEVWNAGPVPRALEHGTGFHLGKNDLLRMTDCFAFAYQRGFLFEDTIEGAAIEGGTWATMNGCATDYCGIGLDVRGEHTLSIAGGSFWDHAQGLLVDGDTARIRLSGSEVKSNGAPPVEVRAAGHVVVTGCSLLRAMPEHPGPAVVLNGGRGIIASNQIEAQGTGIELGKDCQAASLTGNLIESTTDTPVAGNLACLRRDTP